MSVGGECQCQPPEMFDIPDPRHSHVVRSRLKTIQEDGSNYYVANWQSCRVFIRFVGCLITKFSRIQH